MKEFIYVIKDEIGIHARPGGLIVKKATSFQSSITIDKEGKKADAKRLFAIMSLAAKQNDAIHFIIEGTDEELAADELNKLCEEIL